MLQSMSWHIHRKPFDHRKWQCSYDFDNAFFQIIQCQAYWAPLLHPVGQGPLDVLSRRRKGLNDCGVDKPSYEAQCWHRLHYVIDILTQRLLLLDNLNFGKV